MSGQAESKHKEEEIEMDSRARGREGWMEGKKKGWKERRKEGTEQVRQLVTVERKHAP